MSIGEIRTTLLCGGGGMLVLMTLVQIIPIKINPWSWIAKRIGRAINSEVLEKINKNNETVERFKAETAEQWASLRRTHILRFGDEILHGVIHSKEHFDQILVDISKYESYCKDNPEYLNSIANATIEQIKRTYQKYLEDNSFL